MQYNLELALILNSWTIILIQCSGRSVVVQWSCSGRSSDLESIILTKWFLDVSTHLYKGLRPSVHPSVRPSVTRFFK